MDNADQGKGLYRLIYNSRSTSLQGEARDGEIAAILACSQQRNRMLGVTGALLSYNGWYVQALEGPYPTVRPLFDKIARDPRHTDVQLRILEPVPERMFSRWAMKRARAPDRPEGFDIAAASPDDLLQLLKLATLSPVRRAA